MIAVVLALLLGAPSAPKVASPEAGFCSGLAWVDLKPGEKLAVENGPDFLVYRISGPGGAWWGVYSGFAAQIRGNDKVLLSRDGVTVKADKSDGKFDGYLASNARGEQNHFFGSVFRGDPADLSFFDRVDFGPRGRERCVRARHR